MGIVIASYSLLVRIQRDAWHAVCAQIMLDADADDSNVLAPLGNGHFTGINKVSLMQTSPSLYDVTCQVIP